MGSSIKRFEELIKECKWSFENLIKFGVRTEYIIIMEYEVLEDGDSCGVYYEGTLKDFRKLYLDNKIDLNKYTLLFAQEYTHKGRECTQIDVLRKN